MTHRVIGFAGMTHLGLVSAVCAADKGFRVVCFDADEARVGPLRHGVLPVSEPQLDGLVQKNGPRLAFTTTPADLAACDLIYVAADVSTDDEGRSNLGPINALLDIVLDASRRDAIIAVLSQVPPGYTRSRQRTGRALYYQVETLIFGRAVERALHPERYIVGCADASQPLPPAYQDFLAVHGCQVMPMRYESAELAKISINLCLVSSVSVANTIAELCEKIGADWSEIVPALRRDRRIGEHAYLSPGLGIAGGNLERDLATVCRLAKLNETDDCVVQAWLRNSRHRRDWALRTIRVALLDANPGATVAVWGLAYKENTHSTKNSPSLRTIGELTDTRLRLHDPVVSPAAVQHRNAQATADPLAAAAGADALMILTAWSQYRAIAPTDIAKALRGRIVVDPYGVLDSRQAVKAGLDIYALGRPPLIASNRQKCSGT
jgi:UDPglucose 6-dehydrogenase